MKTIFAAWLVLGFLGARLLGQGAAPLNDNFESRTAISGTSITDSSINYYATKEPGEPDILGNPGGKSVWWTWLAPQNGTVTIKTEGSGFDTLLAVYTGANLTNLYEVASGDDSLGADPLTSLVRFHAASGIVYQIVVDGYRGFNGEVASGNIILGLNFVFDRYTIALSVNDTNRGTVNLNPPPDPDGKYLVGSEVTISAIPKPGWYFGSWSGDLAGTNRSVTLTLTNGLAAIADFEPILIKTVGRSPSGFEIYDIIGNNFNVWCPEPGTLNYRLDSDVSWMFFDAPGGVSKGETNTHRIYISTLPPGNHVGTILITPLVDGGLPQSVVVSLRVDAPSLPVRWHTNFSTPGFTRFVQPTVDGGCVVGGTFEGRSDFGQGFGGTDFVAVRLDAKGNRVWAHLFGGTGPETLHSLRQTSDGGFILAGESYSYSDPSGNKTSSGFGRQDLWVVRLDASGNKLWDRSFGGTNDETGGFVQQTVDGGFVVAGSSSSPASGNKASPDYGSGDFWVVRLDANGKRLWDKSFGGTGPETLDFVNSAADGQISLGGFSYSPASGNKTNGAQGVYWIVRMDASGEKLAELGLDVSISKVHSTEDGGFFAVRIVGQNSSYLVTRFDANGNQQWATYIPFWSFRQPGTVDIENIADNRVQVFASASWCCFGSFNESVILDGSGQIVRHQTLLDDSSFAATAAARASDGGWVLCNDSLNIFALKPAPDARPANLPVYSSLGYRFLIGSEANHQYLTEFSTNLSDWLPLQTNQIQGTELEIFDTSATNSPMRFYRTNPLP